MAKIAFNSTTPASALLLAIYDTHGNVYSPSAKAMVPPSGAPADTLMPVSQAPTLQAPGQCYWEDRNFPETQGGYIANVLLATTGAIVEGPITVSPDELYAPGNTIVFTARVR